MWPSQTVRLRPLGVGERIDAAIKIVRANFLTLVRAALIVAVPSGIVIAVISASIHSSQQSLVTQNSTGTKFHTSALYPLLGGDLLTFVIALIVSAFVTVVCFRVIANAYLGQPAQWREALRFGWSRLGAVLWISVLTYLAVACLVLAVTLLIALSVAVHSAVLTVLFGAILGIGGSVATVWFLVASRLAVPVMMLEDYRGTKAIRRALSLCRGYWWSVFGTQFLAGILVAVASVAVAALFGAIFSPFHGSTTSVVIDGFIVQTINYVVFAPFSAAILIVLAIDLKVRKEGFDIELLSAQMGVPASASAFFFAKPVQGGGYPPPGYPPPGYPQSGYPQSGYPQSGYPPGYPPPGYPPQPGYPPPGYPPQPDYPQQPGYPPPSYPTPVSPQPQQPPGPPQYPTPVSPQPQQPPGPPQYPDPWPSTAGGPPPPARYRSSPPGWPRPSDSPPQSDPPPVPTTNPGWPRPSDSPPSSPSYRPPVPPTPPAPPVVPSPPVSPPPPVMPPGWPRPAPRTPRPSGVSPPESEPRETPAPEEPKAPGSE